MDPKEQKQLVQKIIESDTFANKEVLKGLLDYLYDATEKGLDIKEANIAIDYFKRGDSFIPGDDTIVRVNIHKLRQLLDKYYNQEATNDKVQVQIPKGRYAVVFSGVSKSNKSVKKVAPVILVLIIALIISLSINGIFTYEALSKSDLKYHPIWTDYTRSTKPVSIILGDPCFFNLTDSVSGLEMACRSVNINSVKDAKEIFPNAEKLDYTYFSKNNVLPLADIIEFLDGNKKDIHLYALSELNMENVKNNNQVFLANINSFGYYRDFLGKTNIRIFSDPRRIVVYQPKDTFVYEVLEKVGESYYDYCLMVKMPGTENNILTLIGDFHSTGNTGLTSFLKNGEYMKTLEEYAAQKYGAFPNYFEMVVKVSSFHYSDVKTEVVYFNKLEFKETPGIYFPGMMN